MIPYLQAGTLEDHVGLIVAMSRSIPPSAWWGRKLRLPYLLAFSSAFMPRTVSGMVEAGIMVDLQGCKLYEIYANMGLVPHGR